MTNGLIAWQTDLSVLTILEIKSAVQAFYTISNRLLRSKPALLAAIHTFPQRAQEAIISAAIQKQHNLSRPTRIRHREEQETSRRVARRTDDLPPQAEHSNDFSQFLRCPTDDEDKACLAAFYHATNTASTQLAVCAICAREQLQSVIATQSLRLSTIPNTHRLRPTTPHDSHSVLNNCLLLSDLCSDDEDPFVPVCAECLHALQSSVNKPPPYALANGLWIGETPFPLDGLTLPEQLLISRVFTRVFVVKLRPKKKGSGDPNTLQNGLRGNVTSFSMNTQQITDMVLGTLMPRPPSILASLITIAYIGSGQLPKRWLLNSFRVRRHRIREALIWLKAHNPHYHDISLNDDALAALPEDDVPFELYATIRQEENSMLAEREGAGYVPDDVDEEGGQLGDQGISLIFNISYYSH